MKKKIYLVPHMHWDREWYFTFETSNVLLHHALKELKNKMGDEKMLLDGQWSLVDDYIKWNPEDLPTMQKLFKQGGVTSGPLYSQPDVFNSQAETTLRNFEVGKKVAKKFGVDNNNTAYLPDTFGFNQNFPQILKHAGMDNFVFWRGAPKSLMDKSDFFNWEGIDGSVVKSHALKFGYYTLSMYYPYTGDKVYPEKNDPAAFAKHVMDRIERTNNVDGDYIFPMGGDQAPFQWDQIKYFKEVNKEMPDYEIVLASTYSDYMDNFKSEIPTFKGDLRFPIAGKIHRSIASSRYDIKHSFRTAEDKLYYLLEPLEMYYSNIDAKYEFETYKDERIHKPLFIAQTHDSLGACNTDITNQYQEHRLSEIHQNIESQVDLLIKKIEINREIPEEHLIVFNPAPFNTDLYQRKIIYSSTNEKIFVNTDGVQVLTLDSENVKLPGGKDLFKQEVIIYGKNIEKSSFKHISLESSNAGLTLADNSHDSINIVGEKINISINDKTFDLSLALIEDEGDSYDYSPGKDIAFTQSHSINKVIELSENTSYVELETIMKSTIETKFTWSLFIDTETNYINARIKVNNNLKNTRVSLEIINNATKVMKSQHLAISDFVEDDFTENWSETYNEFPAHIDINDGLITMDDLAITTKGNNELHLRDKGISLTLYRTYQHVTHVGAKWRPSTSGLSWFEDSEDSQLQKDLEFEFTFSFDEGIKALNKSKFKPYTYKTQNRNFIANKMTKFAINDIIASHDLKNDIEVSQEIFTSSMRRMDNDIVLRLVNMNNNNVKSWYSHNGIKTEVEFKPYEIKSIEIKGAYNGK